MVRIAGPADHQDLWRMMLMAHSENGLFPLAPAKVDWWLGRMLNPSMIDPADTGPRGAIGVIGNVGRLEGMAFIIIGEWWYSSEKHLEELLVYVDPECRTSSHARALVGWMKAQADQTHMPLVTGVISNHRTEAKVRLYQRLLPPVGAFFLYGAKGSVHSSSAAYA